MALPKRNERPAPVLRERLNRRYLQNYCQHCGDSLELDLGPVTSAPTPEIDAVLIGMAGRICCDACATEYNTLEDARRLREEAGQLIARKDVMPGFGRHELGNCDAQLEMANAGVWSQAREWIASPRRSIMLHGEADSGKTWLARTLILERFKRGESIMEVRGWDLFNGSLLYHDDAVAAKTLRLRTCGLLYVQGVDRGEPKCKHLGLLLEIMEERYDRGRLTIMESQMQPAAIVEKWKNLTGDPGIGGDIFSRLHPVVKFEMQQPRIDGAEVGMRRLAAEKRNP